MMFLSISLSGKGEKGEAKRSREEDYNSQAEEAWAMETTKILRCSWRQNWIADLLPSRAAFGFLVVRS